MQVHILGPVRLQAHEHVQVPATKVRGLLGVLAYRANEPVPASMLVDALWDDGMPKDAVKGLQPHVSRLRRVLIDHNLPAKVVSGHQTYRLVIDPNAVDYHRFVTLVHAGHQESRSGDNESASKRFSAAIELWRGPPIADLTTSWARALQSSVTERDLLPAYSALLDTKLRLGDHDFVTSHLRRLLADHPHNDQLAMLWMRTLTALDRRDQISTFFRAFARRVTDDLGDAPGPEAVRLYRKLTEPDAAAPPRAHTPNLPRETPFFTGRAEALAALDAALLTSEHAAVVAVDGAPAIGKTTLVNHWLRRRYTEFPDGVVRVDLEGFAMHPRVETATALGALLHEFGVPRARIPDDMAARAGLLRQILTGHRVLVIADNAADSGHVRPIVEALPCPVIVTSRKRLTGLALRDGAIRITLLPMPLPETTALLTQRIGQRAVDEPDATADLATLCGGIPLALRLVAEHVVDRPAPTLHELATELRHTRGVLDAGSYGDDGVTTLRTAFSWSYHALRPSTQTTLRQIGLLPTNTFSLAATAAVSGQPEPAAQQALDELLSAHLVEQTSTCRYSTHDLIHRYARSLANTDEPPDDAARAFRRLADWYLAAARQARDHLVADPDPVPDLAHAEEITPLVLAAPEDARDWLLQERDALLEITRQTADRSLSEHTWRLAGCLTMLNRYEDPRVLIVIHQLGHDAAREVGNAVAEGGCLSNAGCMHLRLGEYAQARACFERALAAFRQTNDSYVEALALHNLASVHTKLGNPAEAVVGHKRALSLLASANNPWAAANSHRMLGHAYLALNQHEQAIENYRRSLAISEDAGDLRGQATSLTALARLHIDRGQIDDAVGLGTGALELFDLLLDRANAAETLTVLATAHLNRGTYSDAMLYAEQAVRAYRDIGDSTGQAVALSLLGHASITAGEHTQARLYWQEALTLYGSANHPRVEELRALLGERIPLVPTPRPEHTADLPVRRVH